MINYNEQRIDFVKDQSTEKRIIVPLMNILTIRLVMLEKKLYQ